MTPLPSLVVATSERGMNAGLGLIATTDFSSKVSTQTASSMVRRSRRLSPNSARSQS